MSYRRVDNPRAEKDHERALEQHERAWNQMHETGLTIGRGTPEWEDDRRTVVALRQEVTRARLEADRRRRWVC